MLMVYGRLLQERDFILSESKAIAAYIAAKYDKSERLYPRDPEIRGAVDQRVYFNDRLRATIVSCVWPIKKDLNCCLDYSKNPSYI